MTRQLTQSDLELMIELLIYRKEQIPSGCQSEHMKYGAWIRQYAIEYKDLTGKHYTRTHYNGKKG